MIRQIIDYVQQKPRTTATLGLIGVIGFGSLGWIFPMYIALAFGIIGYILHTRRTKKGKR